VRRHLERLGLAYEYEDLEKNPAAAARLQGLTGGAASHPTVYLGGELLVEPSLVELEWALARSRLR
jgi:mycoredoxin